MYLTIIEKIISYLIPLILGYLISKVGSIKLFKVALMTLIQNNLTNTYFVYEQLGEIPDYIYKNWLNLLKIYEKLGGDDYVHTLAKKMETWKIKRTDILGEK